MNWSHSCFEANTSTGVMVQIMGPWQITFFHTIFSPHLPHSPTRPLPNSWHFHFSWATCICLSNARQYRTPMYLAWWVGPPEFLWFLLQERWRPERWFYDSRVVQAHQVALVSPRFCGTKRFTISSLSPSGSSLSTAHGHMSSRSTPVPRRTGCPPASMPSLSPTSMTAPGMCIESSAWMGQR